MKIIAKPIRMVAVFWPERNPVPYKFKIQDSDGQMQVVRVDRVLESHTSRVAGIDSIVYQCQSIIDGIEHRYELKYLIKECQWVLYKI